MSDLCAVVYRIRGEVFPLGDLESSLQTLRRLELSGYDDANPRTAVEEDIQKLEHAIKEEANKTQCFTEIERRLNIGIASEFFIFTFS
jgi:hypothetical protein